MHEDWTEQLCKDHGWTMDCILCGCDPLLAGPTFWSRYYADAANQAAVCWPCAVKLGWESQFFQLYVGEMQGEEECQSDQLDRPNRNLKSTFLQP